MNQDYEFSSLDDLASKIENAAVAVVGDLILDCYVTGESNRLSPESPVPVLELEQTSEEVQKAGGAANVALQAAALGAQVSLFGFTGDDSMSCRLGEILREEAPTVHVELKEVEGWTVSVKQRFLAGNRHILRVDRDNKANRSPEHESWLIDRLTAWVQIQQRAMPLVLILSDYNKGVFSSDFMAVVVRTMSELGVMVFIDPKNRPPEAMTGAFLIKVNIAEVGATGLDRSLQGLGETAKRLRRTAKSDYVVVTGGKLGFSYSGRKDGSGHVPPRSNSVVDVTGAGDSLIVGLALGFAAQLSATSSFRLANTIASLACQRVGAGQVSFDELRAGVGFDGSKVVNNRHVLASKIVSYRQRGEKIVFTNGVFDLLHLGHVRSLQFAASMGRLVVGVNSDESVRRLKGENRPFHDESERTALLGSLPFVDVVTIFEEDDPLFLINIIKPDCIVKGSEYSPEQVVGASEAQAWGGVVKIFNNSRDLSSTRLAELYGLE